MDLLGRIPIRILFTGIEPLMDVWGRQADSLLRLASRSPHGLFCRMSNIRDTFSWLQGGGFAALQGESGNRLVKSNPARRGFGAETVHAYIHG